jgi:hypothetical protein
MMKNNALSIRKIIFVLTTNPRSGTIMILLLCSTVSDTFYLYQYPRILFTVFARDFDLYIYQKHNTASHLSLAIISDPLMWEENPTSKFKICI